MKPALHRAFARRRRHPLTWKRRWKVLVLDLLGREESAERVAAAIALGIGIGFSPFLGLHFVMALGLALLFRLNKIDTVLGTFAGNPWTWTPVFPIGYRLGRWILGRGHGPVPRLDLERLLHCDLPCALHPIQTAQQVFGRHAFLPRLFSFSVGTTILAGLMGLAAYFAARSALSLYHRRHPRVAMRAAKRRTTAEHKLREPGPARSSRE